MEPTHVLIAFCIFLALHFLVERLQQKYRSFLETQVADRDQRIFRFEQRVDELYKKLDVEMYEKMRAWHAHYEIKRILSGERELQVLVRFENGQEDLVSKDYGPYTYTQTTYTTIRACSGGDEEVELAYWNAKEEGWMLNLSYGDSHVYSDVIFFPYLPGGNQA